MRGLLDEIFPKIERGNCISAQRAFSPHDLLVVAVACEIERKYGVKRSLLASTTEVLRSALKGPRTASRAARLVVTFAPPMATYLTQSAIVQEGLVIPLGRLFAKVDDYLGVGGISGNATQAMLPLSPSIVTKNLGSGSRGR